MTTTAAHRRKAQPANGAPAQVRVAIYARKSTDKNLDGDYTTIDNQIAAVTAYVASQSAQGWVALSEPYTDGGYSGATLERPSFQRLLDDVRARRVNVIAVSRLDRLSRSVRDFIELLALFEKHSVQFVSVTEHFDTTTPMGRFTLGMFMQLAQLEREQIAERVRTKMRGARALGKWQGGRPVLGYSVEAKKLVVNEFEAAVVRDIFATYLRLQSITVTLDELTRRGIRNKSWTTLKGRASGGAAFDANVLRNLLGNPLYAGRMRAGNEVVKAEHSAIVPPATFDAVQALLAEGRTERKRAYRPSGALLQGLLRCGRCGGAMVPHYTQKGTRRFASYLCGLQKRRGTSACPGTRAPAGDVEAFVVERIKDIGKDPTLVSQAVAAASGEIAGQVAERSADLGRLGTEAARLRREHEALVQAVARGDAPSLGPRVEAAHEAAEEADARLSAARAELAALKACAIDEADLRRALESFAVWDDLFPAERQRILHLLIERVVYDAQSAQVSITFRPGGVAELARDQTEPQPTRSDAC